MGTRKSIVAQLIIAFMVLTLVAVKPSHAQSEITVDGQVSESLWNEWFTDNIVDGGSGQLYFTAYWYTDCTNLYIAVKTLTDASIDNNDRDFCKILIDLKDDGIKEDDRGFKIDTMYPPPQMEEGPYWTLTPLPIGVSFVAGSTSGLRSYELCVPLSLLGNPTKISALFLVIDYGVNGVNKHPNEGQGFNFFDSTYWEELYLPPVVDPPFAVPELPLGTVTVLLLTFAALELSLRKNGNQRMKL